MIFNISIWHEYRKKAAMIGKYIDSFKDDKKVIHMKKHALETSIKKITDILKECSEYMDKCGVTLPGALWKYDPKVQLTHASNENFAFKDRMTEKEINRYGDDFMSHPFEQQCKNGKPAKS